MEKADIEDHKTSQKFIETLHWEKIVDEFQRILENLV